MIQKSGLRAILGPSWPHEGVQHPNPKSSENLDFPPLAPPRWKPKSKKNREKDDPKLHVFWLHFLERFFSQLGANLASGWSPKPTQNETKLGPKRHPTSKQAKEAKCARRLGESTIFNDFRVPSWHQILSKIGDKMDREREASWDGFWMALATDFGRFWVQVGSQNRSEKLKNEVPKPFEKKNEKLSEKWGCPSMRLYAGKWGGRPSN